MDRQDSRILGTRERYDWLGSPRSIVADLECRLDGEHWSATRVARFVDEARAVMGRLLDERPGTPDAATAMDLIGQADGLCRALLGHLESLGPGARRAADEGPGGTGGRLDRLQALLERAIPVADALAQAMAELARRLFLLGERDDHWRGTGHGAVLRQDARYMRRRTEATTSAFDLMRTALQLARRLDAGTGEAATAAVPTGGTGG